MSARPSSLLLLLTFAASLPARFGAAWSAFASYDAGADQAQPEPGTSRHGCGEVEEGAAQPATITATEANPAPAPMPASTEPASAESPPEEVAPQSEYDRQLSAALASGLSEPAARVLIANINEQIEWLDAVQTQQWRQACWHAQLASICDAAKRGVVISSIVTDGPALRQFEVARHAIEIFEHNLRKVGLAHRQGDQQAPEPSAWS